MKILHYVGSFSKLSETFIYDLILDLENQKIDNYVLAHERELENERQFSKVKIITENTYILKKIYHRFFAKYNIKNAKYFLKYINQVSPDIIHAHFGPNGIRLVQLLMQYKLDIPVVITFHGTDINSLPELDKQYKKSILELNNYKNLTLIAHTNFLKNQIRKNGITSNIEIVNNGFKSSFLSMKKKSYFQKGDQFKIINVSRLIAWKGHKYLLEAFASLLEFYPNSLLTLIGGGDEKHNLIELSEKLGISKNIDFLGAVSHNEIGHILSQHDVYVQPSIIDPITHQQEGMPIVLLEAIAVGLPVIATRTGGMPEEILSESKYSYLVNEKNAKAIFDVLKHLITTPNTLSDNNSYASEITSKYSMENMIANILEVYDNILNNKTNKTI